MSGSKNNGLFSALFSRKKAEAIATKTLTGEDTTESLEVMPGVRSGSKHLHRVAIYVPKSEHEFYLDGQFVCKDGRGVRLVHVKTGLSVALSKEIFDFMFQQKVK